MQKRLITLQVSFPNVRQYNTNRKIKIPTHPVSRTLSNDSCTTNLIYRLYEATLSTLIHVIQLTSVQYYVLLHDRPSIIT